MMFAFLAAGFLGANRLRPALPPPRPEADVCRLFG